MRLADNLIYLLKLSVNTLITHLYKFLDHFCNLIAEYHIFTLCTETKSHNVDCYWPNPLVESYIIRIHKHFFSNCTMEGVKWGDPPDDTLTILILIPVFLTLAMIALVVWCSKRSDLLA
uniref:Receptor activity-modifying protein 3 n=1 Tax=Cyprinodon variegatus TaxID=28743 RepID=A0A3Q2CBL6_CYPVA